MKQKAIILVLLAFAFLGGNRAFAICSPIMGLGSIQLFDQNGKPLPTGVLYSFVAGTSTQQATYTDVTCLVLNNNPITMTSGGRANIWLLGSNMYKFVACLQNDGAVCAPADVLFSVDQVPGVPGGIGSPFIGTFISGSANPATAGILELASTDLICFRNAANSANLCISKNTSDQLVWPNIAIIGGLLSNCANAAATGFLRLCNTDLINWRNVANSADEGLSTDASDRLNISHAGGVLLTGTNPNFRLGGTSSSFPMWKRVTTELAGRLADDSASAPVSGSTLSFNGPVGTGVTISGGCTSGQILTAASTTSVTCASSQSVLLPSITTLGADTAIGAAATTWLTKAVTMPSTGCPCRAFVSYGAYYDSGDGSGVMNLWVNDGTSDFASSQSLTNAAGGNGPGGSASSFSPNTYSNSAVITFNAKGWTNGATVKIDKLPAFGSAQNSWMNIAIFTSN